MSRNLRSGLQYLSAFFGVLVCLSPLLSKAYAQRGQTPNKFSQVLGITINPRGPRPELGPKGNAIGHEIVCLCGDCPRYTIAECACGWADKQRRVIKKAVDQGLDKERIIAAYKQAYGLSGMTDVPDTPWGRAAYVVPYAACAFFLVLFIVWGARMRKRNAAQAEAGTAGAVPEVDSEDEDRAILSRELNDLD